MSRAASLVALSAVLSFSNITIVTAAEQDTAARPLPTPRQWKIIAALDEATELDFSDRPLADVIDVLKQKHGIEIQLDAKALSDAGVATDTPITRTLKEITVRSALRLLLREYDLTYLIGDGFLLITSKTEAENKLSTRVYPVQDLITLDSEFRPSLRPGEAGEADFRGLIELITSTVAPTTWDEVGGPGAIQPFARSEALAISQTEEAHEDIVSLLAALRRTRDKQLAARRAEPVVQQQRARPGQPLEIKVYRLASPTDQKMQPAAGAQLAQAPPAQAAPEANQPAKAKGNNDASSTEKPSADDAPRSKLDAWAAAIAKLVPEMIEPQSWQPSGEGMIRAVAETIVVRQSAETQYRIGKLINEMLPGSVPASMLTYCAPVRITLPANTGNWPQDAEPQPRHTEGRIDTALEEPCELDFADQPLADVMSRLAEQHHVQVFLDQKALSDAGVATDTPITRSIKGLSLRAALKLLLDELDLTYLIRNEVLMITSKTEAENFLTMKVYPVFDLTARPPDAPANKPALDFQSLIENITSNIAPGSWDEVGGPGAIQSFTNSGALVISQTTEVHEEIAQFLKALRDVGQEQRRK